MALGSPAQTHLQADSRPALANSLHHAMHGPLIGDAWGLPYEFYGPDEVPDEITRPPREGFDRAHATGGRFAGHIATVRAHAKRKGTSYAVDTIVSAACAFDRASSFDDAIVRAIRFGHDTDTTAAITGGLAALKWGVPRERVAFLANHDPLFELDVLVNVVSPLGTEIGL